MWTQKDVGELLNRASSRELAELLICIYNRQTHDEQRSESTSHLNGCGFNAYDAKFLSSVAEKSIKYGRTLTPRQMAPVRKALHKYNRQLMNALNSGEVTLPTNHPAVTQQHPRQPQHSGVSNTVAAQEPPVLSEEEWAELVADVERNEKGEFV